MLLDRVGGIRYAVEMKRSIAFGIVLTVAVTAAWGQFGSVPSGYSAHESGSSQLNFFYPDGWFVVDEADNTALVNREALVEQIVADTADILPGDAIMVIGILPTMFMAMMGIPVDDISTILDGMFDNMVASSGEMENSRKEVHEFGAYSVASVTFDDPEEEASGIFFVAHEQEEVIVFAVVYGFRESLDAHRETLARAVASAEFTGDLSEMMQN